ncbi:MAG TPA: hypothetical protein VK249_08925 [Anaerolineales bacterium]|nr:hypothetical protein [Anaerolineales bacterium]
MRSFIRNFLLTFFLCGMVALVALAKLDYPLTGIDDANIYLVYARNLANGYGFVYNVGGERVEGFTSFLWTLVAAAAFKLSTHPEVILLIINIVILSLGIAVALTYVQKGLPGMEQNRQSRFLYGAVFLVLLLSSPRYIVWNTLTLMENGLWSTLLLVGTIFAIRVPPTPRAIHPGWMPLIVLLVLTRPEAILWGAIFAGILFIRIALSKDLVRAIKDLSPAILCFLGSIALMTLFRLQYFGYPLPNTYYAKVSPSFIYNLQQGSHYLAKYAISDPIVSLSVAVIFVSSLYTLYEIFSRRIANDRSSFLPMIGAVGLLTPLLIGGDHFGSFRLYQNIYPIELLCLLYFASTLLPKFINWIEKFGISPWKRGTFKLGLALVFGIVFAMSQLQLWSYVQSEIGIEFSVANYQRKNGAFIQKLFSTLPQLPSLGAITTGGIKYSYEGEIVDLMGLNNTLMAHNHGDRKGIKNHAAFDIPTFYQLQPDVVWPVTTIEANWQYRESDIKESWENKEGLRGLFDEPHFLELYIYAKVTDQANHRYALIAWFKKDFLKQLANDGFRVEEYEYKP